MRLSSALLAVLCAGCAVLDGSVAERPRVVVTVAPDREGVRVRYDFDIPQTSITFDDEQTQTPHARVSAPDLRFENGALRADGARSEFEIFVQPDQTGANGAYPLLLRVGEGGYLLHLASLWPAPDLYRASGRVDVSDPPVALPRSAENRDWPFGYVYMGPAGAVTAARSLHVVGAPQDPRRSEVAEGGARLLEYFGSRLASPAPAPPTVVLLDNTGIAFGEATPRNRVVAIGLTDIPLLRRLLAHEFFHLWNSDRFTPSADVNDDWVVEGGAEYAALLALAETWPQEGYIKTQLTAALAPCRGSLAGAGLGGLRDQRRSTTRYSCGVLAFWAIDAGVRRATGGRQTVFDVLREALGRESYDLAALLDLTRQRGEGADDAVLHLLHGTGGWTGFREAMARTGGEIAAAPLAEVDYFSAVMVTMRQARWILGHEQRGAVITLDTPDGDSLDGAELTSIEGEPTEGAWRAIYARMSAACAGGGAVRLGVRLRGDSEASERQFACAGPVAPLRARDQVARAFASF